MFERHPASIRPGSLGLLAIALALVALVYGSALAHGFVHDDQALIAESERLKDLGSLPQALVHDLFWLADGEVRPSPYWRPVVTASYYLDQVLWGGQAWGFHLTNLALFLGLGLVAVWRRPPGSAGWLVLGAVLLHPMQVEPAVNISARTDLLAALLGTLAVFQPGPAGAAWTLAALGSKELALVIPLLALARARLTGEGARAWLPQFLAVALWLPLRALLVAGWGLDPADRGGPDMESVLGAGARLFFYLGRLVFPVDSLPARALPQPGPGVEALAALGLLFGLGLLAWRLRSPSEAPPGRSRLLSISLVVLPLLPVCGLLTARVRYAEGFLCWSSVGLAWLLAGLPGRRIWGGPLLLIWGLLAMRQVPSWQSDSRLWEDAWARRPGDPVLGLKLANQRSADGRGDPWVPLRAALAGPLEPRPTREAHALAARLEIGAGRKREALPHLALAALPGDVEADWALVTRCSLEVASGAAPPVPSLAPLGEVCAEAVRRHPDDAELQNSMGVEAARRGDLALALEAFSEAVRLAPERSSFRDNLELAQAELGAR